MSAQGFGVAALVLPIEDRNSGPTGIVNSTLGFQLRASDEIRTLSTNNPNDFDVIQGLLYVPDITSVDNDCSNATLSMIPRNVTTRSDIPPTDLPFIAIAPWTEIGCVQAYLAIMRMEAVRGAIFYQSDSSNTRPPPVSDPIWSLRDGGRWKGQNSFPVYALPGAIGTTIVHQLSLYSGNMSSAPFGQQLEQIYDPEDSVRLFTRINVSTTTGIPSLWVFLIIVLAILLAIVLLTSIIMHMIQRRQRTLLSRRVARGEVDLESLGIKRLNVPQEQLDKMPQYVFTSKAEGAPVSTGKGAPRDVHYSQPTCPICLDDYVSGETNVRELPCNHIFHPECIDPFLRDNSSLCPVCKKSALPVGFCPVNVTNLMVRRERLIRRMRQRNNPDDATSSIPVVRAVQRRVRTLSMPSYAANMVHNSRMHGQGEYRDAAELVNVRGAGLVRRSDMMPAQPAPVARTEGTPAPTASGGASGDEIPAEVRAQGASARRTWLRERLARRQEQQYTEHAQEARAVDLNRPLWRRIGGRFIQRLE